MKIGFLNVKDTMMTITPDLQNMYKEMFKDYFSSRDKLKSEQKKIISEGLKRGIEITFKENSSRKMYDYIIKKYFTGQIELNLEDEVQI